jgi:arachidonate 15-lipoxygenase
MPADGRFQSVAELIELVSLIVFTCSAQHSAVNFPQYDLMTYVPRMPLAAYQPAPTKKTGATHADYLAMLPPMDMAELQVELGYLLGSVRYTQLGQYPEDHFRDPRVAAPLAAFQERLVTIGKTIEHRNTIRRPYNFLLPTGVPQSINI